MTRLKRGVRLACSALLCALFCNGVRAEELDLTSLAKETPEQRAARMQWWNSARFGMFVHWGVYSVTGGEFRGKMPTNSAEWMMNKARIPIADYKTEIVDKFNPTKFDAQAFVGLTKEAGMKYLVITAKHHDGFSMFHSKASPYNVVDATPLKRDIMKELAEACRDQGIRFGFYYSQCQDWHHPGGMGNTWDKTIQRVSFDQYVREKAAPEIKQLLTEYGPISIFWWDTPRDMSKEAFDSLHSSTDLQPGIITNDRLGKEHPGDYKTFERRIPGQPPVGENWEVCMPISGSWGYKKSDTDFKSTTTLIRNLADIASKGGNYLLNVSPTGEGTLLPQAVQRLQAIGQWMKVNGESIYDTTASPFGKLDWGRCTQKKLADGTILYLHVFDWPQDGVLLVPGLTNQVKQAYLLAGQTSLEAKRQDEGVIVSLPALAPGPINSVVVLQVDGTLDIEPLLPTPSDDGSLVLSADEAYIHNNEGSRQVRLQLREDTPNNIGYWTDANAWVEWSFKVEQPGEFEILAELAVEQDRSRFRIELAGQQKFVEVDSSGSYYRYVKKPLTTIRIDQAGKYTLSIKPDKDDWQPINLRQLELKRRDLAESTENCSADEKPFTHPGILHSRAELDFVKTQVAQGKEPWKSAWEELRSHDISQLDWKPKPIADVVRGVRNRPDIGGTNLMRDGAAAYSHAIQWYVTGKQPHADKAIEILNAYAGTLKSIGGHDARLLAGMAGITFTNAAEIIRHTDAGWNEPDQERFEHLLREVFYDVIKDFYPTANGNWDAAMIQTMLAMGVFLDDRAMFQRAVDYTLSDKGNGAIGKYFNEFGECQESGRDQAHTQMGLGYLGCAAEIAWKQGVDLYGALDNRLALGFEYTAKYNLGHEVPYEPYRSHEGRYYYPKISDDSRGRFSSIYERVYHHYHDRMGLEMPFTAQVIEKIRPERWRSSHASWGTLMHAGQPAN